MGYGSKPDGQTYKQKKIQKQIIYVIFYLHALEYITRVFIGVALERKVKNLIQWNNEIKIRVMSWNSLLFN